MSNKVINQHFVQRKYLELFAGSEKFYAFDKSSCKSFSTNVKNVANERFFYDIPELDAITGESQYLEKYFHPFEGSAAEIISRLLLSLDDRSFKILNDEDRKQLSTYFALQYLRTKESRVTSTEVVEKILKEMAFALGGDELSALGIKKEHIIAKVNEDKIPSIHAMNILNEDLRDEIAGILHNHIWLVIRNMTDNPLYTSDHPLVKNGHLKDPFLSMNGLSSPGIEIDFPLSSKYLISMVDREYFKKYEPWDGKIHDVATNDAIIWYNHLQVNQSYRQIFCSVPDFGLVEEMILKNPELSNLSYDRVQVSGG